MLGENILQSACKVHISRCSLGSRARRAASDQFGAWLLELLQNQTGQDRADGAACILGYPSGFLSLQ